MCRPTDGNTSYERSPILELRLTKLPSELSQFAAPTPNNCNESGGGCFTLTSSTCVELSLWRALLLTRQARTRPLQQGAIRNRGTKSDLDPNDDAIETLA